LVSSRTSIMLAMLTRAGRAHIGVRSGLGDRTLIRSADPEIAATVAPVTEPAGVDSGVLSPRFLQRPWLLVALDVLLAAWIAFLTVNATLYAAVGLTSGTVVVVWLLALAVSVPLTVRRLRPIPVFGVVLAATILAVLLGMPAAAIVLAVAVALYSVALSLGPRRSAVALGAAILGVALAAVLAATVLDPHFLLVAPNIKSVNNDVLSSLSSSWFAIGAGWTFGCSVRARREYAGQIAEHREQKAVSEERLRIAREMHDVVAHSMSVIVMKAAVANHVYDTRPEESREALGVIESVSRAALADIQRVVGSLRSAGEAHLAPSPGLDDLPKLVENARLADVQVELDRGTIPALPAAVQLSAYRIVQEALTNVIKHAATPARCTVRITGEPGALHLAVIDDGIPRRPVGEPGHGLIGMRERAALHHGTLVAGRQPNGGFAVHARLPYQSPGPA
jgi:signal transduction histidine kinase